MPAPPPTVAPAVAPAPRPAPVKLWGEAAELMTIAEVQALYPTAVAAAPVRLADGAVARLTYQAALSTGPAQVVFCFRGEELDAVLVHVLEVRPGAPGNLRTARTLRDTLSETYGAPTVESETSRDGFRSLNAQWTGQPLKVGLGFQDVGDRRTTLWVAFRAWEPNRRLPTAPRRFIKGSGRPHA